MYWLSPIDEVPFLDQATGQLHYCSLSHWIRLLSEYGRLLACVPSGQLLICPSNSVCLPSISSTTVLQFLCCKTPMSIVYLNSHKRSSKRSLSPLFYADTSRSVEMLPIEIARKCTLQIPTCSTGYSRKQCQIITCPGIMLCRSLIGNMLSCSCPSAKQIPAVSGNNNIIVITRVQNLSIPSHLLSY
uniref:Uncharacterized protein n=1 Tax=Elaeophora elaphi TaxID=1147741 RepID=A0A0R3RFU7_9BILA